MKCAASEVVCRRRCFVLLVGHNEQRHNQCGKRENDDADQKTSDKVARTIALGVAIIIVSVAHRDVF